MCLISLDFENGIKLIINFYEKYSLFWLCVYDICYRRIMLNNLVKVYFIDFLSWFYDFLEKFIMVYLVLVVVCDFLLFFYFQEGYRDGVDVGKVVIFQ